MNRISGPILDRIDIQVRLEDVDWHRLTESERGESSRRILQRVLAARRIQSRRFEGTGIASNSRIPPKYMEKFCPMSDGAKKVMKRAFESMNLSARAYDKILKTARTIADMDGCDKIEDMHILEAVGYRDLDREVI